MCDSTLFLAGKKFYTLSIMADEKPPKKPAAPSGPERDIFAEAS